MKKERKWTDSQLLAIDTHGRNILVSASAGSGKTAALTERILRTLKNSALHPDEYEFKTDISRMLIVTFTKNAASELRERITESLSDAIAQYPDNEYLRKQIMLLPGAQISTIDSFYMNTVRNNFTKLGIPSSIRIGDTPELSVMYYDIMEETVASFFEMTESEDIDFAEFADNFTGAKNDSTLSHKLLKIYNELIQYPEGIKLLKDFADEYESSCDIDFLDTRPGKVVKERISRILSDNIPIYMNIIDDMEGYPNIHKAYNEAFSLDLQFCKELLYALNHEGYVKVSEIARNFTFKDLTRCTKPEDATARSSFQDTRNTFKSRITPLLASIKPFPQEIPFYLRETAKICKVLYLFFSEYERSVLEEKNARGVYDFSDITAFMLKLLVDEKGQPTDAARAIGEKYDEIFIDEYQDTNAIQDAIFCAISNKNNRFMVGDIKQSIYSFRGAQPDIFANYRKIFPLLSENDPCNASIFMSENFRCDENIIKFVNSVFSYLFPLCADSIGYTKNDDLIYSKEKPHNSYVSPKVSVALVTSVSADAVEEEAADDEEDTAESREYIYIANEIRRLVNGGTKADGSRIRPCDITILVRTQDQIDQIKKLFKELSIKAVSPSSENLFRTPEVMLMSSLLSVIDNPTNDVDLAALLRSPVFDFDLDELIHIRFEGKTSASLYENLKLYSNKDEPDNTTVKKCRAFLDWLEKYRIVAQSMPVDKLLRIIYRDPRCSFVYSSKSMTLFYDHARQYESGSFRGLYNFLRYIDSIKDLENTSSSEFVPDENAITVMTIHKSKGLEFPVCFIAGLLRGFNFTDLYKDFVFERKTGIAVNISDSTGFAKYKTPLRSGIALSKRKSMMEEQMRNLYVAMTRAREKLYLTAEIKNIEKAVTTFDDAASKNNFDSEFYVSSFFTWVMNATAKYLYENRQSIRALIDGDCECDFFEIITPKVDLSSYEVITSGDVPNHESAADKSVVDALTEEFKERFSFSYPHPYSTNMPSKLSVSRLTPDLLDKLDEDDSPIGFGIRKEIALKTELDLETDRKPTAAEKGSATHLVFQFCDFDLLRKNGAEAELNRLLEMRFISSATVDIVRKNEIDGFAKTPLFERICAAKKLYREQRFNIRFKASDFTSSSKLKEILEDNGEDLLIQGVIDLLFIDADGKLILCDYKTDRISKELLDSDDPDGKITALMKERHGEQLFYYAKAVEKIFGRYPDESVIYLTQLGKTYSVN